jgi:hypothetical protein
MLNKPIVLSTGEWVLPAYLLQHNHGTGVFNGAFPEYDLYRGINLLVSKDSGETFEYRACIPTPNPNWHEAMLIEKKNGALWLLSRTKKGIVEMYSSDKGYSWTEPIYSKISHPNARFFIRRLASGRIILIKHGSKIDEHQGRYKLSAWLSEDEGATWRGGLIIENRQKVSYPDGFQAPDGTIYITYDRNRSTDGEILMARITEEDILTGKLTHPNSRLKMLIKTKNKKAKKL